MFPIFINDGKNEVPEDDIFYIICKEGVYLKKRMGVMESMAPVQNISILESVQATARMHIVPIPGPLFAKVMSFFRAVYKEHRSEAIVLIFYNEKTDAYKIFPPYQKVNFGTVDYNKGIQLDGWQMIGTIHSHASMSAFHSGVDDDDEKNFDGLHITIGDNDDDEPSISASIVANGSRFMIDPLDYVEDLQITVDIDNTEKVPSRKYYKWVNGKMIEAKTSTIRSYRKMDKRFMSTVTNVQKLFNQKWMSMVEYITPTYHYGQHNGAWGGWGGSYDPNAWKNWRKNRPGQPLKALPPPQGAKIHPQNVGPHKVAGIKFPEHDQEDMNPCKDCVFVNHKMDWVMQQLLDEVDQKDNPDVLPAGMESYKCTECDTEMVIPDTQDAICPICKVDHYLVDTTPFPDPDEDPTYQCTECDVEFTLADNDEPAVCPACKTNENVMLLEPEEEYTYEEEEEETPYQCSHCKKKFFLVTNENCPHCGHSILETESEQIVASDMGQTKIDCKTCKITLQVRDLYDGECPFCQTILIPKEESDFLDPDTDAIQAAIEADQEIERLPIPDQGIIPINQPKKKEGPFAFMKRLGKIRGRKGIK